MFRYLMLTVLILTIGGVYSAKANNLLRNSTFLDANGDGIPDDWYPTTKREGNIERKEEAGQRYIHIAIETKGESVILEQWNAIPTGSKTLSVGAKVRWQDIVRGKAGWNVGNVQIMFQDANKKQVGKYFSVKSFTGSSAGWQTIRQTFDVPVGAIKFRTQVALYQLTKGALDIGWVTAQSGADVIEPTPQALAEKHAPIKALSPLISSDQPLPVGDGPVVDGVAGVDVLGQDGLFSQLKPYRMVEKFDVKTVETDHPHFKKALQVIIKEQPNAVWDMQLRGAPKVRVKEGDILHLTMWLRALNTESEFGEAAPLFAWQLDKSPWSSAFQLRPKAQLKKGWVKIQRAMVAKADLDPNNSAVNFQLGLAPQTFEMGGLSLYNYGKTIDIKSLPTVKPPLYDGHQLDHPWRAAAQKRIDQHRKADLKINVVDQDGNPVPHATLDVKMQRHHFLWGTSVYHWKFWGNYKANPEALRYMDEVKRLFNFIVSENGHKWSAWEDKRGRQANDILMAWAEKNNIAVRGHTTIWPSFRRSPKRIEALKNNPEALRKAINKHIDDITQAEKGKLREWDVMNEPTTNWEFMKLLGKEEVAQWYKRVHAIDPQAKLYLNENQVLAGTKIKSLERWASIIMDNGGPLHGLGIQGHLGVGTATPMRMIEIFDRLSKDGLKLAITELDVLHDDQALQAMYLRDVMLAVFSHPAMESLTFWGFWDGRHWKTNTPLFDKEWNRKKGLDVYENLVFKQWWTNLSAQTNTKGMYSARVFKGDYVVTVTVGDEVKTVKTTIVDDNALTITLQ